MQGPPENIDRTGPLDRPARNVFASGKHIEVASGAHRLAERLIFSSTYASRISNAKDPIS